MCGRYSLAVDPAQLRTRFALGDSLIEAPRYNIAPGDEIAALVSDRDGRPRGAVLRWGLVPAFASTSRPSRAMFNARAETVAQRPAFRTAFATGRCLIPADGFYEWSHGRAHHIRRADGELFAFAAIAAVWHRDTVEEVRSAAILTTRANERIAPLHERMPVILDRDAEAIWLDPGTPAPVLKELMLGLSAEATAVRRVGDAVNHARHDAPDCLDDPPAELPVPRSPQIALF
jgi:putative SOS response-associated peptidase YedK